MPRVLIVSMIAALLLAACGQVVTLTLPGGPKAGQAPRGYELLFSPAPHAFRYTAPGEPVRRGKVSERFELRDGDCGGSDCGTFRYRSEVREDNRTIKARIGRDIWYGWSFHNVNIASVSRNESLGTVFGQWKLEGNQPPVFRIVQTALGSGEWANCDPAVCNRSAETALDVVVELEEMRVANGWGATQNFGNVCKLFSMAQNRGKWVDLVVNTNFSPGPDGYLRVWVNGELKCNYSGPLLSAASAASGLPPGHRRGIFASYTQRWTQTQGAATKPTMIVHYDEFLVGKSREAVDTRLREAADLRPKD